MKFKQTGLAIETLPNCINLQPITSTGKHGRAMIEIPLDSVPSVIKALKKALKEPPKETLTDFCLRAGVVNRETLAEFSQQQ